jgi:cytoskeletal protein CcmA (bactofilin family)
VRLLATAILTGDIEAPRVAIDEGAVFDGQIRMRKKTVAPRPQIQAAREIPELASPGRKALIRKTS